MARLRFILDDGTPHCLPAWARNEIVDTRLKVNAACSALLDNDCDRALVALGFTDLLNFKRSLEREESS